MKKKLNCIMVIDDDEPTNFISSILFEEANCTRHLEIVDGGMKALNYLKNSATCENAEEHIDMPDLVFLDINMPSMNGWEFLDEYKKLQGNHRAATVIIMLTTSLSPDDKCRAASNPQVAGFETKPLTTAIIDRVIKTHFEKAGAFPENK